MPKKTKSKRRPLRSSNRANLGPSDRAKEPSTTQDEAATRPRRRDDDADAAAPRRETEADAREAAESRSRDPFFLPATQKGSLAAILAEKAAESRSAREAADDDGDAEGRNSEGKLIHLCSWSERKRRAQLDGHFGFKEASEATSAESRRRLNLRNRANAAWNQTTRAASRAAVADQGTLHHELSSAWEGVDPDAMLATLRAALDKRGRAIVRAWRDMGPDARRDLLLTVCPFLAAQILLRRIAATPRPRRGRSVSTGARLGTCR